MNLQSSQRRTSPSRNRIFLIVIKDRSWDQNNIGWETMEKTAAHKQHVCVD